MAEAFKWELGDLVQVRADSWWGLGYTTHPPQGEVIYIGPSGRILIQGCGFQFLPHELEPLWVEVKLPSDW